MSEKTTKKADKKSDAKKLQEKLCRKPKHAGLIMSEKEISSCQKFCEDYKTFLDNAKTEREAVKEAVKLAKKKGFSKYKHGNKLSAGDKIYWVNREKAVIFAIIGSEDIENGAHIAAAHIDSPRLDLKQNPLYEENEIALFKTHYYGGIKKYQWTAIPLSLHGVIIKENGEKIDVNIGEEAGDPVFCVSDLLPHLAADQMKRNTPELIKGEELNIIIGSMPFKDDEISEKVKLNIMSILNEKYGIIEDDFISAELEAVPAFKASDVGFDRSVIGSYGQDDRVCAYTSLIALLDCDSVKKTAIVVLADKEETGSDGNTGLNSDYLKHFINYIGRDLGASNFRSIIANSECLSADVNAGYDPTFADVNDRRNCAYLNYGVVVTKFTGSRGKSGTSDASAEFVGRIRSLLDGNKVIWQTGELGKVDMGGGGTVAAYLANMNMDVIDIGVPVLSMHAPYELTAKTDVYMCYKAIHTFISE